MIKIDYSTELMDIIKSPEFLAHRAKKYGDQDKFSFRSFPYKGIVHDIMDFAYSDNISPEYKSFLEKCLVQRKLTYNGQLVGSKQ